MGRVVLKVLIGFATIEHLGKVIHDIFATHLFISFFC
jgi:hypothetical protein